MYWVDDSAGKVFCLVEAPDAESAARVHIDANGLVADRIWRSRKKRTAYTVA